jgi:hypothetical protein
MKGSPNERDGGDGGIPRVFHADRARPAAPHHERWATLHLMKSRLFILLLSGCCFLFGCQREASIPSDSFRLTVQQVVSDTDNKVSLLTIQLSRAASVSIDGDGFHKQVALPDAQEGVVREAQVSLSAARVAPSQDKFAYVQTLIHVKTASGSAGGPDVHPVPTGTTLASFFSISATGGVYKLDTPVTIAQMQGKPVTLVVGKLTK